MCPSLPVAASLRYVVIINNKFRRPSSMFKIKSWADMSHLECLQTVLGACPGRQKEGLRRRYDQEEKSEGYKDVLTGTRPISPRQLPRRDMEKS